MLFDHTTTTIVRRTDVIKEFNLIIVECSVLHINATYTIRTTTIASKLFINSIDVCKPFFEELPPTRKFSLQNFALL